MIQPRKRTGIMLKEIRLNSKDVKRFWNGVEIKEIDQCWNWKHSTTGNGHGMICINGRKINVHRVSYMLHNNTEIPKGKVICHTCDNKKCCNPNHLYCGTQGDNLRDRYLRGSKERGQKLFSGEVWLIRKLRIFMPKNSCSNKTYIFNAAFVAKMFKVSKATILRIWNSTSFLCKNGELA